MFRPRPSRDGRRHDLAPRVSMGMFVGYGLRNSDVFVMTAAGIVKGNTITRRPPADQYKYENWSELRGVPWRLQSREPGQLRVALPVVVGPQARLPLEEVIPRNFYVLKSDIEAFGHTPFCPGCEADIMGTGRRAHNAECRFRIQSELMKTDAGKERIEKAKARVEAGRRPKAPRCEGGDAEAVDAADVPALVDRPEPDAEMAAGEAAGEPLDRVAPQELMEREAETREKKRQKPDKARDKRKSDEDVEDLHHRVTAGDKESMQEEVASGSGGQATGSRDAQPERPAVDTPDASSGGDVLDIGQLSICLCSVLREARKTGKIKNTVSEIFSPPRVAAQAQLVGMRPGFSIDLETRRESDGEFWD